MRNLDFYEIVTIASTPLTEERGVAGMRGVIVGYNYEDHYSVSFGDDSILLHFSDLRGTGERVDRASIYDGESISVAPQDYGSEDAELH